MKTCAGSPSSTSRRARRFTSKARCKRANGRINRAQDRYSTEVVLQGFRGELTLLDRAGGAGAGGAAAILARMSGGDFGSPGPTRKVAAAATARGSRGGAGGDMDDEIPF